MYAGESHERRIFIVRRGKVVWSYDDPAGKGEISDAVMLSNGNVLFAHQFGVTELPPDQKVIWNYDAPSGDEIHTALPIGRDHIPLHTEWRSSGDPDRQHRHQCQRERSLCRSAISPAHTGSFVTPG
jgi:hypothetical protein